MKWLPWVRLNWDRAGGWLFAAGGGVALLVGWIGASNSGFPAGQLPYILSGGIGGILLVVFGATLLISADLRDEWKELAQIRRLLEAQRPSAAEVSELTPVDPDASGEIAGSAELASRTNGVRRGVLRAGGRS